MSKEQEQNINIKSFTDLVDKISSGKNKEVTIFDLASAYGGINIYIKNYLDDDKKADLQEYLAKKYNFKNQNSLSEIIDNITGQAIDKAIANKYKITIFDINNTISLFPEKLVMKIIASTSSEYLKIENYLSLKDVSEEQITEIYKNIILSNKCPTEILKALFEKELYRNKLLDHIEKQIFTDGDKINESYFKYKEKFKKIDTELKTDLKNTLISKIKNRDTYNAVKNILANCNNIKDVIDFHAKKLDSFKDFPVAILVQDFLIEKKISLAKITEEEIKYLAQHIDPNIQDKSLNRNTLLFVAVKAKNLELTKFLIEYGADINDKIYYSKTALHEAIETEQTNIIELLIDNGADIYAQDDKGQSAVGYALLKEGIIELLIKKGLDVNHKYKDGKTPLHKAIETGTPNNIELLIKHGADINAQDKDGKTPLHKAIELKNHEITNLLIKNGVKIPKNIDYLASSTAAIALTTLPGLIISGSLAIINHFNKMLSPFVSDFVIKMSASFFAISSLSTLFTITVRAYHSVVDNNLLPYNSQKTKFLSLYKVDNNMKKYLYQRQIEQEEHNKPGGPSL
jgi:ankyrin repeat protein